MKPVLIFRHISVEGPGYFGEFLTRRGVPLRVVAIDEGEPVPDDLERFSGLAFMGGPMSVNDPLPWIEPELSLIRRAHAGQLPVLGHCLGGQLISKALGGTVQPNAVTEIGWHEVATLRDGDAGGWTERLPDRFVSFHWHGETFSLPEGASLLLTNRYCANQGFVLGNTLALQCHVEMTADMVCEWVDLYAEALEFPSDSLQDGDSIIRNADDRCRALQVWADILYGRWLQGLKR